ncbi:MAG: hypothetical protein KF757_10950 [Phycisphaeraceae bacterium]|nr:hypothetical protein [Phycisphaeraceae bacterium]MCW5762207.1 hypothetical protein [Phycisphaeraceae bacterium]
MLTDVMSGLKLDIFPTIGMALFLIAFVAVAIRALCSSRSAMAEAAQVPLLEDPTEKSKGA